MSSVIELRDVHLGFRGMSLLTGVNLVIEEGASYALHGPNGSGKSALLRLMCGITRPTSGSVRVAAKYLDADRTYPDRFGVAIDGPAYVGHLSGVQNLRELAGIRKMVGVARIHATMRTFGLDPLLRTRVSRYSLGMKQKLSLCQVFLEEPDVVLLDEPFNALDRESVSLLRNQLEEFRGRGGTLVMTSHERAHLDGLVDVALEIEGGKVNVTV
ncbi:ATP-binding cassette domain-containing protein [Agromyces archimandritae]|uniref:ABC transporter ATP-binding protein n=1 Tax=Agromyces archimandritae TaxID=2781962 RepID=A0A975IP57_9MICO|nr:ABC transporter ATP-binding protein [Agromyces archimandritae]QTX05303.1 ABC transporter ATP-binding protein [Agromyces archimandritae]